MRPIRKKNVTERPRNASWVLWALIWVLGFMPQQAGHPHSPGARPAKQGSKAATSWLLAARDLRDADQLAVLLADGVGPLSRYLYQRFSPGAQRRLRAFTDTYPYSPDYGYRHPRYQAIHALLLQEFNRLLASPDLYSQAGFEGVKLTDESRRLLAAQARGASRMRLNRLLLSEGLIGFVSRDPVHISEARVQQAIRLIEAMPSLENVAKDNVAVRARILRHLEALSRYRLDDLEEAVARCIRKDPGYEEDVERKRIKLMMLNAYLFAIPEEYQRLLWPFSRGAKGKLELTGTFEDYHFSETYPSVFYQFAYFRLHYGVRKELQKAKN